MVYWVSRYWMRTNRRTGHDSCREIAISGCPNADSSRYSNWQIRYNKNWLIVRHFFNDLYDCLFLYHSFVDLLLITLFINLFFFIVIIWRKRPFSLRGQLNLKFANKILKNISNKKREPRMPRTTNLQKRVNIISPSYSYDRGLPSSWLTPFA